MTNVFLSRYNTFSLFYPNFYIRLNPHKLQLQKHEMKKAKEKIRVHNVSKNTTYQMHTNYAQRKRKIT